MKMARTVLAGTACVAAARVKRTSVSLAISKAKKPQVSAKSVQPRDHTSAEDVYRSCAHIAGAV